ncbi:MAG: extracellular solute-binding protein [Lachnospiraceae bacterium]|nr:extracellular solute-binding protein [Lachnospiraceae bacterium]
MKKFLCSVIIIVLCLAGCAYSDKKVLDPENPVVINMWHNYGGEMQTTMDYLIDQFNGTVGKEEGIVINVTAISSSSELNKSLDMIVNDDPGAPDMPDIFTGYPKVAIQFQRKGMLADLKNYFTEEELEVYVDAFVEEGILDDGGLYVFPVAKSTEILYINRTLFDRFAKETGASYDDFSTFEGIAKLSKDYYLWTDAKTPGVANDGKQFFTADSWFNVAEVAMEQLGDSIFDEEGHVSPEGENYRYIFENFYWPAVEGGVAIHNGYSSDLSKTGDIVCSTGSSAGILFYGDTITYPDGTVEQAEYDMLPYPVFEGGRNIALQRGGGLMVAKTDEKTELAASVFIKWFADAEQNMKFISRTGYLPVTKQAFEEDMALHIEDMEEGSIKKMLTAVFSMYDGWEFFTAPNTVDFDDESSAYEQQFKEVLNKERAGFLNGEEISPETAFDKLKSM